MTADTFFKNFLASSDITGTRLGNFAGIAVSRFTAYDETGKTDKWKAAIDLLNTVLPDFLQELGELDQARNIGLGHTDQTDAVLEAFGKRMREEEPFIARALGGKGTPAYLEFYPHGKSEYHHVTKTEAPLLLLRVYNAAAKYAAGLGKTLSEDLRAYKPAYEDKRGTQTGNQGTISQNRAERSDKRKALELVLLQVMHQVGEAYPGDVDTCGQFFDFRALYPPPQPKEDEEEPMP